MTTGTPGVQVYFFGVGGSGRRPVSPPTRRYEGAGVRVNQEKKWKLIVGYREVMKKAVKCSLRRAGGQRLKGTKGTPGPSVRLHI